jgi:hypothetical protein
VAAGAAGSLVVGMTYPVAVQRTVLINAPTLFAKSFNS